MGASIYHLFSRVLSTTGTDPRLLVETLSTDQTTILNGLGYQTTWVEDSIPNNGGIAWAEFIVPPNLYMVLSNRVINTEGSKKVYKVFPESTYTVGTNKVDDATSFATTRNLRQGSLNYDSLRRVNVSSPPIDGEEIIHVPVYGAEGKGNSSSGTLATDNSFLLLNPDQRFLLGVENNGASAASANVVLNYAFIPESLMRDPLQ